MTITPRRLREAAEKALQLDDFLGECNQERIFFLIGFDLPFLAEKFEAVANQLDNRRR